MQASPKQIRVLQNLIIAHLDELQSIPIDAGGFRKLKASGKLNMLRRHFSHCRKLCPLEEARQLILKVACVLRIFTRNVVGST